MQDFFKQEKIILKEPNDSDFKLVDQEELSEILFVITKSGEIFDSNCLAHEIIAIENKLKINEVVRLILVKKNFKYKPMKLIDNVCLSGIYKSLPTPFKLTNFYLEKIEKYAKAKIKDNEKL